MYASSEKKANLSTMCWWVTKYSTILIKCKYTAVNNWVTQLGLVMANYNVYNGYYKFG